jgi:hypothetical protein
MKSTFSQMLFVVAVVIASLLCWNVYAQDKQPNKVVWEYNLVTSRGDNVYPISQLGAEGWELVSIRSEEEMIGNIRQTKVHYYLKRAKQVQK